MNPNGDLAAMKEFRHVLKDDGRLFLTVPVGEDLLKFNAERIYGRCRYSKLTKGWKVLEKIGMYGEDPSHDYFNGPNGFQPLAILQKIHP